MSVPTDDACGPVRNEILRGLPPTRLAALLPRLETVQLDLKSLLHHAEHPIDHVYFVESGTVSMIALLTDGRQAEVGMIGREGLVGLSVVLGSTITPYDALVQVNGSARRMAAGPFRQMTAEMPELRDRLLLYVHLFHLQVAQTAACNSWHTIDKRLARWLLITADKVGKDQFPMTQEFLSRMLAVQRPGVNLAMRRLQRDGLVQHRRNWLGVINRPGLEAASCECYATVRDRSAIVSAALEAA